MADTQQARECPHIKACHEDECAGICKQPAPEGELQSWCPTEVAVAVLRREWYALTSERDALAAKAAENFAAAVEAQERADALAAKLEQARESLHEIAEEWAGAECGEPVHAQEAYAIGLAKRMYSIAADALAQEPAAPANAPADGNV